jgi:hypothetical protein
MAKMKYCESLNSKQFCRCLLVTILLIGIILLLICYNRFIILAKFTPQIILFVLIGFFVIIIKWNNQNWVKRKARWPESYIWRCGCRIIEILKCSYDIFRHILGGDPFLFDIKDACGNFKKELDLLSKSDSASISKNLREEFKDKGFELQENAKVWAIDPNNKWKIQDKNSPYIIEKEGQNLKICRENYFFVDTWVLVHLVLAIIIFALWSSIQNHILGVVFIAVGIYRVYEYFIYQTDAVLCVLEKTKRKARVTRREKTPPIILNPYRILILSILGYVNVIIWFAVFYRYIEHAFIKPLNWFSSLNYSFFTMTNFGHTNNVLPYPYGIISLIQSAMGLFLIILIIANFVSSLPKPDYYD